MLCPCDNITGYLNGLQYLQNPVSLVYPGKFKLKLWCSVLVTTSLVTLMVSSISLGYLPGLPPEHFSLLSLSLMLSHCSLHLRPPCSYAILALTLSLLLHYPCSYAILALTPSLLLGHPCSKAILALRPSLLLPHLCSLTSLLLTHIFFQVIFSPFYLCPHALFHSYSLSACVNFLLSTSTTYGVYQDACPVVI